MIPMPTTTFGGDGKASAFAERFLRNRKMSHEANVEDVAQSETNEVRFEGFGIRDADTPEGQFANCELVDTDTGDLIGFLKEERPKGATDEEVRRAIETVEGDI